MSDVVTPIETWVLSPEHMQSILDRAEPGSVIVYAVGYLAFERAKRVRDRLVDAVPTAKLAYSMQERGEVHLLHKKLAPYKYEYWAVKR